MPLAVPPSHLSHALLARQDQSPSANPEDVLQVVCAWPVSGQYGPGSRFLYYVLVVACVLARKHPMIRDPCVGVALLVPVVAALHAITLAAVHVDGAVDLDLYGAFQLCTIGILAAPVTVRLSQTYFYGPGRNLIFGWTVSILAGLLGLCVEFFRQDPSPCPVESNDPIPLDTSTEDYLNVPETKCNIVCDQDRGPFSPMRGGSGNNIYLIRAPTKLSFNTALLLSAACCIPAILSMVFMWSKIVEVNTREQMGEDEARKPIEGTRATVGGMNKVNELVRRLLLVVEVPVFAAAILAILILGELNFWSEQVYYMTEPLASVGQWAPIVGTGLGALGSIYVLSDKKSREPDSPPPENADKTGGQQPMGEDVASQGLFITQPDSVYAPRSSSSASDISDAPAMQPVAQTQTMGTVRTTRTTRTTGTTRTRPDAPQDSTGQEPDDTDTGGRRWMTRKLTEISNYMTTASPERMAPDFQSLAAANYPVLPGEQFRNGQLTETQERYKQGAPSIRRQRSRTNSFNASIASGAALDRISTTPASAPRPRSIVSSPPRSPQPRHSNTFPRNSSEINSPVTPTSPDVPHHRPRTNTLEVPTEENAFMFRARLEHASSSVSQGDLPGPARGRTVSNSTSASTSPSRTRASQDRNASPQGST